MRARISAHVFAPENRKWWTLVAVSFGLFMIMLDNTVVNVALPSIQRDLTADQSELEWVVVSYALTFATFMLTGGKLADYFGRRLLFITGLVVFAGASLACGLAPDAHFLIGARAFQGIGAAIMNPARGYGALKAILDVLAQEEPLTLTEIAQRLHRTPGSTKDYLSWLEDVDLITSRQKRYSFTDPVMRLWVRLHCRAVPPGDEDVAREVHSYVIARLPHSEPALALAGEQADALPAKNWGIIEID